jgi:hypothetical protein
VTDLEPPALPELPDLESSLDSPLIYVASALSHLSADERKLIEAWAREIRHAVDEATFESERPWITKVHLPTQRSSPSRAPDMTPRQVYELNSETVLADADALIVIGHGGGSFGSGQELDWACQAGIPILYLRHSDEPLSRQVQGLTFEADLDIRTFADGPQAAVRQWIASRRHAIEHGPSRRRDRALATAALRGALYARWRELGASERLEVCATARIKAARVNRLLREPNLLAAGASLDQVRRLAGALGLEPGAYLAPEALPQLAPTQLQALEAAAEEYEWTGHETVRIARHAQRELARGTIRRLSFTTTEDWVRFKAAMRT